MSDEQYTHDTPQRTVEETEASCDLFREAMLYKLLQPRIIRKEHWRNVDVEYLRGRLGDELKELDAELENGDMYGIAHECIDIANLAMMIYEKANGIC